MSDKYYVGLDLTGFQDNGQTRPISRVTLFVDKDNVLTAGDDSGLELTADCPYATQAMADALYAALKGRVYRMYSADGAALDPAAEPGDGVTVNGIYSVIAQIHENGDAYPSISAPGEGELEDEYPTTGPVTQQFNRQIAQTRSEIAKTADEIRLSVSNDMSKVNAELALKVGKDDNGQIVSMLNASADTINIKGNRFVLDSTNFKVAADGKITATAGEIAGWEIGRNNLSYEDEQNIFAIYPKGFFTNYTTDKNDVLYIGTKNNDGTWSYPFRLYKNGKLEATGVTVTGKVSANKESTYSGALDGAWGSVTGVTGSVSKLTGTLDGITGTVSALKGTLDNIEGSLKQAILDSCGTDGSSLGLAYGAVNTHNSAMNVSGNGSIYINPGSYYWTFDSWGNFGGPGNISCNGNITCTGTKPRTMTTQHFGKRQLDAFETPMPTFADYGTSRLDETGVCYITLDPIFAETINPSYLPTVFLTKYGQGDIWVDKVKWDAVTIRGTPGLPFAWETRYQQDNCDQGRLREYAFEGDRQPAIRGFDGDANLDLEMTETDLANSSRQYIDDYNMQAVDYGAEGYTYFTAFERSLTA